MTPVVALRKDFEVFRAQCIRVCEFFQTYETLFEKANHDLLHEAAALFFLDVQDALQAWCWLQSCRITDPASAWGRKNLTVPYFDEQLREYGLVTPICFDASSGLMKYRSFIEEARNRLLAHADRDSVLADLPMGGHPRSEMLAFLNSIQVYCDAVADTLGLLPLDFRSPSGPGDAHDLLKVLREGLKAKACSRSEERPVDDSCKGSIEH